MNEQRSKPQVKQAALFWSATPCMNAHDVGTINEQSKRAIVGTYQVKVEVGWAVMVMVGADWEALSLQQGSRG